MVKETSHKIRDAAVLSLAASMVLQNHAAGSPVPSGSGNSTNQIAQTGWPDVAEPTFNMSKVTNGGPLNAVLWQGPQFTANMTEWASVPNHVESNSTVLPASCFNCNPKGCMCSEASILSLNNTGLGKVVNQCEVCRDSEAGMLCYCSVSQLYPSIVCNGASTPTDSSGLQVCRLNKEDAAEATSNATEPTLILSESGAGSSKGKKVKAAGAAALAALGTATAMIL